MLVFFYVLTLLQKAVFPSLKLAFSRGQFCGFEDLRTPKKNTKNIYRVSIIHAKPLKKKENIIPQKKQTILSFFKALLYSPTGPQQPTNSPRLQNAPGLRGEAEAEVAHHVGGRAEARGARANQATLVVLG